MRPSPSPALAFGARPGEIAQTSRRLRDYLKDQIRREGTDLPQGDKETTARRLVEFRAYPIIIAQAKAAKPDASPNPVKGARNAMRRAQSDIPPPRRGTGLNENLAREILELHTAGIDGGYSQSDVTEFARALTGLSVACPRNFDAASPVAFPEIAHEPGDRSVMGARYGKTGKAQAGAILSDLAANPQTAPTPRRSDSSARRSPATLSPTNRSQRWSQTWRRSGWLWVVIWHGSPRP